MKTCSKCKIEKTLESFSKAKPDRDTLRVWCKQCFCENRKKTSEKRKENNTIIPERKCGTCRVIKTSDNFHKCSSYFGGIHSNCKDCRSIERRLSRIKNPPKKTVSTYQNKTKKLKRKKRVPAWADINKINEIYKSRPSGYHVDHIIPLNGELVSGLHVHENLQYLTPEENLEKSNKFIPYMRIIGESIEDK